MKPERVGNKRDKSGWKMTYVFNVLNSRMLSLESLSTEKKQKSFHRLRDE